LGIAWLSGFCLPAVAALSPGELPGGVWGALSRFGARRCRFPLRVGVPSRRSRGVALVLVAWLPGVALPAATHAPAAAFGELQGTGDRRAAAGAVGAAPADGSSTAAAERPAPARSGEPAAAPLAMGLIPRDPDHVASLAPAARCSPLDIRHSRRPAAGRRRDPRARPPPCSRTRAGATSGSLARSTGSG